METQVWSRSRLTSISNAEHASKACRDHSLRARRETSQDQPTQVLVSLYLLSPCGSESPGLESSSTETVWETYAERPCHSKFVVSALCQTLLKRGGELQGQRQVHLA